jgi:hypothetical protein
MRGNHLAPFLAVAIMSLASSTNGAFAQEASTKPRHDFGKRMIERPLEDSLAPLRAIDNKVSADVGGKPVFVNPKVEPGQVTWHHDFKEACASSKSSGKPVLLFQMMGKLDDRFC